MSENIELVRPSALPKLAACRCFEGAPGTSEAAERGTRIDKAIRVMWARMVCTEYGEEELPELKDTEEKDAVMWAIEQLESVSHDGDLFIETDEAKLRAVSQVHGVKDGTMDALCVEGAFLVDFKSGQVRNYKEQMAAYALSCMEEYFADSWTAYLLFVDQRSIVGHSFTADEARRIVEEVVAKPKVPTNCDYCKWCAKFATCPAVTGAVAEVQESPALPACTAAAKSKGELPDLMQGMLTDHAKAHEFLSKLAIVNDWADELKKRLKTALTPAKGAPAVDDPYFTRVVVAGQRKVMPLAMGRYMDRLGWQRILSICPLLPVKDVEEKWKEVYGNEKMPDDLFTTVGGSVQLRLKKQKK